MGGRWWEATAGSPAPLQRETRQSPGKRAARRIMATGGFATLPSTPEDGGSGGFTPGGFKDPKRLYCKNGGFFLRIRSDGGVDGIREKSDAHSKYFQSSSSSSPLCFTHTKLLYALFSLFKTITEERCELSSCVRLTRHDVCRPLFWKV